jgi:hypothetical protein
MPLDTGPEGLAPRQDHAEVVMGSLMRIALPAHWRLLCSRTVVAGIASDVHVSAIACVLPIALDEAARSPAVQLSIPPDSKMAMLRAHHVVGVAGEYCIRSVGGREDDARL